MPAELMALAVREFGITIDRAAKPADARRCYRPARADDDACTIALVTSPGSGPSSGVLEVTADLVGELMDLLLGRQQSGLGLVGALGRPPLSQRRLPVRMHGPRLPPEQSHDPVLSVRDAGRIPHPATHAGGVHVSGCPTLCRDGINFWALTHFGRPLSGYGCPTWRCQVLPAPASCCRHIPARRYLYGS